MSSKVQKAYIAAPPQVDTAFLRECLLAEQISFDDAYTFRANQSARDLLLRRVRNADFVIALITSGSWSTYEIGIADALGKPVLVLAAPDVELPPFLATHQHLRTEFYETPLLRLTIEKFVDEVRMGGRRLSTRHTKPKPTTLSPFDLQQIAGQIRDARATAGAEKIEELVQQLLKSVSVTVASQDADHKDRGVDFAVWEDALAHTVGNPLLVEVKAGTLTRKRLMVAEQELVHAMHASRARFALLLYLDREGQRFPQIYGESHSVLRYDIEDLAQELQHRPFANIVLEGRNNLVHGIR